MPCVLPAILGPGAVPVTGRAEHGCSAPSRLVTSNDGILGLGCDVLRNVRIRAGLGCAASRHLCKDSLSVCSLYEGIPPRVFAARALRGSLQNKGEERFVREHGAPAGP